MKILLFWNFVTSENGFWSLLSRGESVRQLWEVKTIYQKLQELVILTGKTGGGYFSNSHASPRWSRLEIRMPRVKSPSFLFRRIGKKNCEKRILALSLLSVRPHGTIRLPLGGLSLNLVFHYLSKLRLENSSFIKIWQQYWVLYMKTNIHLWSYLSQFPLKWEMFQTKFLEKIKSHISRSNPHPHTPPPPENRAVYEMWNIWWGRTGHRWQYNTAHEHGILDN